MGIKKRGWRWWKLLRVFLGNGIIRNNGIKAGFSGRGITLNKASLLSDRMEKYAHSDTTTLYNDLGITRNGLRLKQVEAMKKKYGDNNIVARKADTIWFRLRRALINPFTIILFILEYYMDILGNESNEVLRFAYLNSLYHSGVKKPIDNAILECRNMPQKNEYYETLARQHHKAGEIPFDYTRKCQYTHRRR